ncbi:MAG TPA: transglutaminase domain-containing protein, partial [Candidatus Hydrogenedentes bacterium]|nr:transglutaminase domain-containing protein [Candidatus Hydrogenedentota bacterium]
YNELVGADWSRAAGELESHEWRVRDRGVLERVTAGGGREIEQEIFLQSITDRVGIPAMPNAKRFIPPDGTRFQADDWDPYTIRVARGTSQTFSYTAVSEYRQFSEAELVAAPGNYEEVFRRSRVLALYTSQRISERSRALARNLTASSQSPYEKALAIERHLRESGEFLYTNSLEELSESDPIDSFLFEQKAGHCELYASSMCMLVRSLGIPARVASGYKVTDFDWNEDDEAYIVRERHAHLWVEVYLNGIGWYSFDPSGILPLDNSLIARIQRALTRYVLNMKVLYYRDIVGFSSGIQLGNLISFSIGLFRFDFDLMREAIPSLSFFTEGLPRAILIFCLTAAVLWGFYVMYRSAALRKMQGPGYTFTEDQVRATRVYLQLKRRLTAIGVNGHAVGARDLLKEVESNLPVLREPVANIVRTYNDARFGGRVLTKEQYAALLREVKAIQKPRS